MGEPGSAFRDVDHPHMAILPGPRLIVARRDEGHFSDVSGDRAPPLVDDTFPSRATPSGPFLPAEGALVQAFD
jgi:hypothetical protein